MCTANFHVDVGQVETLVMRQRKCKAGIAREWTFLERKYLWADTAELNDIEAKLALILIPLDLGNARGLLGSALA